MTEEIIEEEVDSVDVSVIPMAEVYGTALLCLRHEASHLLRGLFQDACKAEPKFLLTVLFINGLLRKGKLSGNAYLREHMEIGELA
jgi:hypothetical protein